LSPALAALILKPHAHHGEGPKPEALPRIAIVFLMGLLFWFELSGVVGGWFGIESGHGGGHAAGHHEPSALVAWGVPLAVFALGAVVGWLTAGAINGLLNRFFAAFNRFFDRATEAYGRGVTYLLKASVVVLVLYAGLLVLTGWGFA